MLRQLLGGDSEMNNNINGVSLTSAMDPFHWQFPTNSSVSGTSELFSSTFAMLSGGDAATPFPDQWNEQKPNVGSGLFFDQNSSTPIVPGLYDPAIDNAMPRFESPQAMPYRLYPSQNPFMLPYQQLAQPLPNNNQNLPLNKVAQSFGAPPTTTQSNQILRPNPSHPVRNENPSTSNKMNQRCNNYNSSDSSRGDTSPMNDAQPNNGSAGSGNADVGEVRASSGKALPEDSLPFGFQKLQGSGEDVRVMCLACKGVYPSRRSLTGHIGRNEKCREIIGRNYLDQVAAGANPIAPGTESALKAGALTNGQDGLSPVCPYCDRFISHYKGNIRRHINQCGKNNTGTRRPRPDKEKDRKRGKKRADDGPPAILQDGFEPNYPFSVSPNMNMMPPQNGVNGVTTTTFLPTMNEENTAVQLPTDPSPPNGIRKDSEPPEDAYICGQCDFVTIYKGNMKRHLNTCHPAPECKDLKEWDRKLESMRASALGISKDEMMDRLQAHKMNSTRGRKPRPKPDGTMSQNGQALATNAAPPVQNGPNSNQMQQQPQTSLHQSQMQPQPHMQMMQPQSLPPSHQQMHYNYGNYL
ncbi:unnamed protein product [Auanema sp. JU1783]|nr:unnamed protein product [Auanema sp. JU1783]